MSGKRGAWGKKATVSVDLALLLSQRGYQVGLMDVDLHGPSVAGMLGFMDKHVQVKGKTGALPLQRPSGIPVRPGLPGPAGRCPDLAGSPEGGGHPAVHERYQNGIPWIT